MAAKQAPSIGSNSVTLEVISVARTISVSGARTTPVKNAAIPTTAKPTGSSARPGKTDWQIRP